MIRTIETAATPSAALRVEPSQPPRCTMCAEGRIRERMAQDILGLVDVTAADGLTVERWQLVELGWTEAQVITHGATATRQATDLAASRILDLAAA